jgi:hypothetical protein
MSENPNDKSQVKCFLCDDGSTTLYCLNCAGDLLDKHLVALQSQLTKAQERVKELESVIKDDCESEELLKLEALKVLPEIQVKGDSLGVPGVADIGENLVARVKVLEGELETARQLLVTASGAGEYGKGDDWAKRYKDWQEAVMVFGVKTVRNYECETIR